MGVVTQRLDMGFRKGYDGRDVFSDADTRRFIVPYLINDKSKE